MSELKPLDITKTYRCVHGYDWTFDSYQHNMAPYSLMWRVKPNHYKMTDKFGRSINGPDLVEAVEPIEDIDRLMAEEIEPFLGNFAESKRESIRTMCREVIEGIFRLSLDSITTKDFFVILFTSLKGAAMIQLHFKGKFVTIADDPIGPYYSVYRGEQSLIKSKATDINHVHWLLGLKEEGR